MIASRARVCVLRFNGPSLVNDCGFLPEGVSRGVDSMELLVAVVNGRRYS